MSYVKQKVEWTVPLSEVQVGVTIGYIVEFSTTPYFYPITYRLTTYEEEIGSIAGTFYYSLDNGVTWIDFPYGGQSFTTSYKMRLIVNSANEGFIFAEQDGIVYRIRGDNLSIIDQFEVDSFSTSCFEIDSIRNDLYLTGQNKTAYKVSTTDGLKYGDNSINIHSNPLGILVDGIRDSFWQVDTTKVCLKDLEGNELFCVDMNPSSYIDRFRFTIETTSSPQNFTLPLTNVSPGHNFTVYWGDGSSNIITQWNDANRIHSYASAGTYHVAISGICSGFEFDNGGSKNLVKSVDSWGNVSFKSLNFYGCSNLNSLPNEDGKLASALDLSSLFRGTAITSIFYRTFSNCTNVTDLSYVFANTGITSIPYGLFDYCTAATNFQGCFAYAPVTSIPTDLFDYCVNATNFSYCFDNCSSMTSIPAGLFDNCVNATNFQTCFYDNAIISIPTGLFDNCVNATNFSYCFSNCASLATIPSAMFDGFTNVVTFEGCFKFCPSIVTIPSYLFSNCSNVTSFDSCFYSDTSVQTVSSTLFNNCSAVTTYYGCFYRANVTSISADLFASSPDVLDFEACFHAASLTSIPPALFNSCSNVTSFRYCFYDCLDLTGDAPGLWERIPEPDGQECFQHDTGLDNYHSIPESWGGGAGSSSSSSYIENWSSSSSSSSS